MSMDRGADTSLPQALSSIGERIPTQYIAQLHEPGSREDRDKERERCSDEPLGNATSESPMYWQDPLINEELLGSFDIPVSPQLHFLPLGDL